MQYYFSIILPLGFDEAMRQTVDALKSEGFGIITEIDVKKTLKEKLGADFRNYHILGACNPKLAYEALQLEDKVGTMLPCNVVINDLLKIVPKLRRSILSLPCRQSIIHHLSSRRSASGPCYRM